jgi:hypothetical protein
MLATSKQRISEMLKVNPQRYGAFKEKGTGGRYKPSFRERWRVPRSSVEKLRADMGKG